MNIPSLSELRGTLEAIKGCTEVRYDHDDPRSVDDCWKSVDEIIKRLEQNTVNLIADLAEAEAKAWDALSRYKFQMFGYWAAIWVHLNRIGGFKKPNPWGRLVRDAKYRC